MPLAADREAREIPTRRISFGDSVATIPKHFAPDEDLIASHLAVVLSSVFPDGEDFFVRSVRRFRDDITDPDLRRQVAGFIGQEAVHGREHRSLNAHFAELGYPTRRIERMVRWGFALRERAASPRFNLATTAALEHFTATFAEILMSDEHARGLLGPPELTDIFLWHALEECEHKAVAFDVYRAVGGSERSRRISMNVITFGFIVFVTLHVVLSLLADRETYRRGRLRASVRRLRDNPLLRREVWRRLRDYNRLGFHPDDHDTEHLLAAWRTEFFGPDGHLNDKLVGAS